MATENAIAVNNHTDSNCTLAEATAICSVAILQGNNIAKAKVKQTILLKFIFVHCLNVIVACICVCTANASGNLADIVERTKIEKYPGGIHFTEDDGATWTDLGADTIVSMNMWGFTPSFLDAIEAQFPDFLAQQVPQNPAKAEFLLPRSVDAMLKAGQATVKVLKSEDRWYGVTYAADKPMVVAALAGLHAQGKYPDGLWK